ncbi:hypothetical protein B0H12DRAFT_808840 [Mycena haematopus]|nr:hypothetical protein B0H12DRAFT_808840 [Mycena haematopus]
MPPLAIPRRVYLGTLRTYPDAASKILSEPMITLDERIYSKTIRHSSHPTCRPSGVSSGTAILSFVSILGMAGIYMPRNGVPLMQCNPRIVAEHPVESDCLGNTVLTFEPKLGRMILSRQLGAFLCLSKSAL